LAARVLYFRASLAVKQGDLTAARRSAAPSLLEPAERDIRAYDLDWLRATLGEIAVASAVTAGEPLSLDDAISLLRQLLQ
jgi:hypothetical protein